MPSRYIKGTRGATITHGTTNAYNYWRCRCDACTTAQRDYRRKQRGWDPNTEFPAPRIRGSLEERFWPKVEKTDTCWLWTAWVSRTTGYGMVSAGGRNGGMLNAHRVAYELSVGPIPDGLTIDHICRVRRCVNPAHLRLLTNVENARDNGFATRTHCPHGHPYNEANTRRRVQPNGSVHRECRACKRARRVTRAS